MKFTKKSVGRSAAVFSVLILVLGLAALACAAPETTDRAPGGDVAPLAPVAAGVQEPAVGTPLSMARAIDFAGKFHPMVLHFPIALILTALLAEMLALVSGKPIFSQTARLTLILAVLSVAVAVPLGWAAAVSKEYVDDYARMLWWHRWMGTATGILVLMVACLSELSQLRRERTSLRMAYRAGLVLAAGSVAVAGHCGALLVYGLGYFSN